jgi:predicted nucleic-acid-binding protein
MKYFVDTNIFLRFLTRDQEKQYQAIKVFLKNAPQKKINLVTSSLVIFEIIWTLLSYYEETKEDVVDKITSLLELPSLEVEHKEIFLESLTIWQQTNIDFNDAFNYVWARKKNTDAIYSLDKHFDRLPQLSRLEP